MNRLQSLQRFGQSIWLDDLRRGLLTSGEFQRLIDEDGLRGVTSNPACLEQAIAGTTDYLPVLRRFDDGASTTSMSLYETMATRDVRDAADLLRPIYDATNRTDGYVTLDLSPYLAHATAALVTEAHRLWTNTDRENLMIKVPATIEGLAAIRQLTSEGINVNATLLFSVDRYEQAAHAYMDGLSAFIDRGGDPSGVGSVASVCVSRIDTAIDKLLAGRLAGAKPHDRAEIESLLGKAAIASARLMYQCYRSLCRSRQWQFLAAKGAHPQRLLWASTSPKDARYTDVHYVEELIGIDTVTTLSPATAAAFRDHGRPRSSLEHGLEEARAVVNLLPAMGIQLERVADTLLEDAVASSETSFDTLLATVARARAGARITASAPRS